MIQYMTERGARRAIVKYGKKVYDRGYVAANDGNITMKISETEILATPTGVSKGDLNEDMLIKMDLDGNILSKSEYRPSSEIKMHLRVYNENPMVNAVIHAHPIAATALAIIGEPVIPNTLAEPMMMLGEIPVADFALPSTKEVPESIAGYCKTHTCALLANHGAITWGRNIQDAYFKFESLEHFCKIYLCTRYIAQGGKPIPEEKIATMMRMVDLMKQGIALSDITEDQLRMEK